MSLNQIINPIKPLDVIFGNITADNLSGTETTFLKDVVGGSLLPGDNVASSSLITNNVFIQQLGDVVENVIGRYKQKRYYALEGEITTPAVLVAGKEGSFELSLNDPSITTDFANINKTLVSAIGVVNDGVNNLLGSLYIDANTISNGSILLRFISVYGALKPNTGYKTNFDLTFYY